MVTSVKALYLDKRRIQDLINQQRKNLAEVGYLDLNSVAKILKNIEKSHDKGKKLLDESRSELEDSDVRFRGKEEPPLQSTDKNGTHDVVKLTDIDAFTAGAYDKEAVKRNNSENKKSKDYRYEITEIELMEGTHGDDINNPLPRTTNNSISTAKILKNIEKSYDKGEKLLDKSSSKLEDSGVRFCEKEEPPLQTTDENGTHDVIKLTDIDAFTAGAYDKEAVKRNNSENKKSKDYRYEITEIELMEGTHGDDNNGELPRSGNNSISTAKILKNNEKSYDKWEKLLDKSSSKLEDSDVRFRGEEEPVFYSSARRSVENIKQERATPE